MSKKNYTFCSTGIFSHSSLPFSSFSWLLLQLHYPTVKPSLSQYLNLTAHFHFPPVSLLLLLRDVQAQSGVGPVFKRFWRCRQFSRPDSASSTVGAEPRAAPCHMHGVWKCHSDTTALAAVVVTPQQGDLSRAVVRHVDGGESGQLTSVLAHFIFSEVSSHRGAQTLGLVSIAAGKQTWPRSFEWIFIDSCQ